MPSPVAVRSAGCSLSIAAFIAARLVVGATSKVALAANSTNPRLMHGVSTSAKCLAADWAASMSNVRAIEELTISAC